MVTRGVKTTPLPRGSDLGEISAVIESGSVGAGAAIPIGTFKAPTDSSARVSSDSTRNRLRFRCARLAAMGDSPLEMICRSIVPQLQDMLQHQVVTQRLRVATAFL